MPKFQNSTNGIRTVALNNFESPASYLSTYCRTYQLDDQTTSDESLFQPVSEAVCYYPYAGLLHSNKQWHLVPKWYSSRELDRDD